MSYTTIVNNGHRELIISSFTSHLSESPMFGCLTCNWVKFVKIPKQKFESELMNSCFVLCRIKHAVSANESVRYMETFIIIIKYNE